MTVLLDLLSPYPVLENLASALALGDLLNLSRVSSAYRGALHGFGKFHLEEDEGSSSGNVRSTLLIGQHQTTFWANLKARSRLECSEPQHTRGSNPQGCRNCSMPTCEACIVKASFGKRSENTFQNRHRSLCADCWQSGNQHKKHLIMTSRHRPLKSYPDQALDGEFCVCAAKDGILCLNCKTDQNTRVGIEAERCYGQGCSNGNPKSRATPMEGRVCLWCDRQLPGSRSRAESRREYDARHILARSHSSYDRPPEEEEDFDGFEEQRMLELDALSNKKKEIRTEASRTTASIEVHDPLNNTTEGRKRTEFAAYAREEEAWDRSEEARRQEWPTSFPRRRKASDLPRYEDHDNSSIATDHNPSMAVAGANHAIRSAEDRRLEGEAEHRTPDGRAKQLT